LINYKKYRTVVEAALLDKHKGVRLAALKSLVQAGDKSALRALQKAQPTVAKEYPRELPLLEGCMGVLRLPKYARKLPFLDDGW